MGMNLHLRTFDQALEVLYVDSGESLYLNRNYSSFILGIEASGDDCVYNQMEKIYELDLSPLRKFNYGGMGLYEEEYAGVREWELSKATTPAEKEEINREFDEIIASAKEEDLKSFEEDWESTEVIRKTIEQFIAKVQHDPDKLSKIVADEFLEAENFEMNPARHVENQYYIIEDFQHILDFIDFIESKGETRIAFYEA